MILIPNTNDLVANKYFGSSSQSYLVKFMKNIMMDDVICMINMTQFKCSP